MYQDDADLDCPIKPPTAVAGVVKWAFFIFFVVKAILFDWQFYNYSKRYYETYKTFNQVEIWIMVLTAIKITLVVPDYLYCSVNWLYFIFIANSAVTFWLSHLLHMRACVVRQGSVCEARAFVVLLCLRLFIVLVLIPFFGPYMDTLMRNVDTFDYQVILYC